MSRDDDGSRTRPISCWICSVFKGLAPSFSNLMNLVGSESKCCWVGSRGGIQLIRVGNGASHIRINYMLGSGRVRVC